LARAASRRTGGTDAAVLPDAYEKRDVAYHERLRAGYMAVAKAEPHRCVLIDGAQRPDAIAALVWAEVNQRLLTGAP
jgi:dTMP kinase